MARRGKALAGLATLAVLVALAVFALRHGSTPPADNAGPPETDEHLRELRLRVEREAAADAAARNYRPKVAGRLDDLTALAADILRGLPGVAEVEVPVRPKWPSTRSRPEGDSRSDAHKVRQHRVDCAPPRA